MELLVEVKTKEIIGKPLILPHFIHRDTNMVLMVEDKTKEY